MSMVFRRKRSLTIAQLTHAWGYELAKEGGEDPGQCEEALRHVVLEDMVNGHLDDAGPPWDGRRLGVACITADNRHGFIEGRYFLDLIRTEPSRSWVWHNVVVTKEAALDFARRHALLPPTWWREDAVLSTTTGAGLGTASRPSVPTAETRPRGRRPEKRTHVEEAMRRDIQQGQQTLEGLKNMPEKTLAATYGFSRETARKALTAVKSEMSSGSQSQL